MKHLTRLFANAFLVFLATFPLLAGTQTQELPEALRQEFDKRFDWYQKQKNNLEEMLKNHQVLKEQAEKGTDASDFSVAAKNQQAVAVMDEAIATTDNKLRKIDGEIKGLEEKLGVCLEMQKKFKSTREALMRLQRTIESGAVQFDDLARQSEEAVQGAKDAGYEMLKTGVLGELGDALDKEINLVKDPARLAELKRAKRAVDQTLSAMDEMDAAGEHQHSPDLEKKLNMGLTVLGDPAIQEVLKLSSDLAPLASAAKSGVDYTYHATSFGLSWARIRQLSGNATQSLQAVRALHEQMKQRIKELEENYCHLEGGEAVV